MTAEKSEAKERRGKALELHLAGASYQAIADLLGYASRGSAHDAVKTALGDIAPDSSQYQATAVARVDAMLNGIWHKARRGDVQAIDRVLKLEERREALLEAEAAGATPEVSTGGSKLAKLRAIHVEQRAG